MIQPEPDTSTYPAIETEIKQDSVKLLGMVEAGRSLVP